MQVHPSSDVDNGNDDGKNDKKKKHRKDKKEKKEKTHEKHHDESSDEKKKDHHHKKHHKHHKSKEANSNDVLHLNENLELDKKNTDSDIISSIPTLNLNELEDISKHKDKETKHKHKDKHKERHKEKHKHKHAKDVGEDRVKGTESDDKAQLNKINKYEKSGTDSLDDNSRVNLAESTVDKKHEGNLTARNDVDDSSSSSSSSESSSDVDVKDVVKDTARNKLRRAAHTANKLKKDIKQLRTINFLFQSVPPEKDRLSAFIPHHHKEPILESVSEIIFKDYPWQLKVFAYSLLLLQFFTLLALIAYLTRCPDKRAAWSVVIGIPLCAGYAGIESVHQMLRYVHLGSPHRFKVVLIVANGILQLVAIGAVMGKSPDMMQLISDFIGVAIVLQIDDFLASYLRIKDIDPAMLNEKSWRSKMLLSSKIFMVILFGFLVYLVCIFFWYTDDLYCFNKSEKETQDQVT